MNKINTNKSIALSKLLSWVLRHGANELNVPIDSNGFIDVDDLLRLRQFTVKNYTLCDIKFVVANDRKSRFALIESNGCIKIKANQGHSMRTVVDLSLNPVTSPTPFPIVVHGTFRKHWSSILATGLRCMNRVHIHFATTQKWTPTTTAGISGLRENCEILIYCNLPLALADGIQFWISDNRVLLTSGVNGVLPVKYFLKVIDRKSRNRML